MPLDWYPKSDVQLIPWHATFADECTANASKFPNILTAPVLTQIGKNRDMVVVAVNGADAAKNFANEVVAYKNAVLSGLPNAPMPAVPTLPVVMVPPAGAIASIEQYTRSLVGQLKADPGMDDGIAQGMGIVGTPSAGGTPSVIALALSQYQVQLSLTKAGYDFLAVDSKRGAEPWTELIRVGNSPYIDARPPAVANTPELREYRVQGVENNVRVGPVSGIVSAVASA